MNIVHLIWGLNIGGAESMLVDIVNHQVKEDTVSIIIINNEYQPSLLDTINKKVKIILLNRQAGSKSIFPIIKLNFILFKINPDVIHCHNANIINIISPTFKKTCLTLHCAGIPTNNLHKYRKVFAISDFVKEELVSRSNVDVDVIENGINIENIEKRTNHIYDKSLKIVQVSRLDKNVKGQDILIEAINILNTKGIKNVFVDFIGDGPSSTELKELTNKYSLEERIRFLGSRDRKYIYTNLKNYDLMCHPARTEGFGLVVIEGLAAQLPILIPNQGGAYEVTNKGKLATTFMNEDPNSCASKIIEIMGNYKNALGIMPKVEKYISRYSIRETVIKYRSKYLEMQK